MENQSLPTPFRNSISSPDSISVGISKKLEILDNAAANLKKHFIGIDDQIDQIIKNIRTWYVMPELITHPVIVCLFGPTGVGKTDLVRKLVKEINMQERFCEFILGTEGCPTYPWANNVSTLLNHEGDIFNDKSPSILLLDEIQGFRTIDEEGNEILNCKFRDLWTLLSDGKLPHTPDTEQLVAKLWKINGKINRGEGDKPLVENVLSEGVDPYEENEWGVTLWDEAREFKSLVRSSESVGDIVGWPLQKKKEEIIKVLNDKSIYDEDDYTKTLIFISGNIDEAYVYSKHVEEVDMDADILHHVSKRINVLDIKKALCAKFKPEQISRMGNNHVVYPLLNKSAFQEIIKNKIGEIVRRIESKFNIRVDVEDSVYKMIYDNGVFPTQGTRPVFSTITSVFDNCVPDFLLQLIMKEKNQITLSYYDGHLIGEIEGSEKIAKPYIGSIDALKNRRSKQYDRKALISVHEGGHAVMFASLFNQTPYQLVSNTASNDVDGYVDAIQTCDSYDMSLKKIYVLLAGKVAEKIIFGSEHSTGGCENDLSRATVIAAAMIRKHGMDKFKAVISTVDKTDMANNDIDGSNYLIEEYVSRALEETEKRLVAHTDLLLCVSRYLIDNGTMSPIDFQSMCLEHGLNVEIADLNDDMIYWGYAKKFDDFCDNHTPKPNVSDTSSVDEWSLGV